MKVFDGLLSEIDEKLPLSGHVFRLLEHIDLVEDLIAFLFVWPQKVVISDPESDIIIRTVIVIISALNTVCFLIGAVQALDDLLEGTEFFGDFIIIRQADDLSDVKLEILTVFMEELLCCQDIRTVTVRDKAEVVREFSEPAEGHTHSQDTGADASVV